MTNENCPKCRGTGIVKEKDGSCHCCWDCLRKGDLDQHSKEVKDYKVKI